MGVVRRKRSNNRLDDPARLETDRHIGDRIRVRRALLGLSQERLGDAVGVTFQQIHKYERGTNGVSAALLWRIAEVLDVPVSFFYDGLGDGSVTRTLPSLRVVRVARAIEQVKPTVAVALTDLIEAIGSTSDFLEPDYMPRQPAA
ncbi:MAG: helix-turn-helix transcriptional regulator [Azospirillaceae bacterium]|nr:helix-turn-helix transcriptional regulator [Azospirillaceae bacterium]